MEKGEIEKRVNIGMKIRPSILAAIDTVADEDHRSRSNLIELILTIWLTDTRPDLVPDEPVWETRTGPLMPHPRPYRDELGDRK